jgi:hypothetical protein
LHVLLRLRLADKLNSGLLIFPVGGSEAVVDGSSIAVLFFKSLVNHTLQEVLGEVAIFGFYKFWLGDFSRLQLALLRLLLGFFFLSLFHLFLSLVKVFLSLFVERVVTLLPEIDDLIEADDTSLVLLGHVVGSSGLTALVRSNQEDVKFVLILNWRR